MRRAALGIVAAACCAGLASAQAAPPQDLGAVRQVLTRLVHRHVPQRATTWQVAEPAPAEGGGSVVYACWRAGHTVLILPQPLDPATLDEDWQWRKGRVDLAMQVVPTLAAAAGSTYLVDRAWADAVLARCARGAILHIAPRQTLRKQ